jgi:hypothetical protein
MTNLRLIVTPPSQCEARREPTPWELAKYWLLGPVRGFDPRYECRCHHYEGHLEFGHNNPNQAEHEDYTGRRWV